MACKIIAPFRDCPNELANAVFKIQEAVAATAVVDAIYPLVQAARRNGKDGKPITYPRLSLIESDKVVEQDMFPGKKLESSYAFFEMLSDVVVADGLESISYTLGLVFFMTAPDNCGPEVCLETVTDARSKVFNAIVNLTEVSGVRMEMRISRVWGEYTYTIMDFGQFQHPHYTFKITFTVNEDYDCCQIC